MAKFRLLILTQLNMNKTFKRYLISSLITFFTGVCLYLLSVWDTITLETLKDGSLLGLAFLAFRAGLKGLIEYFLSLNSPTD